MNDICEDFDDFAPIEYVCEPPKDKNPERLSFEALVNYRESRRVYARTEVSRLKVKQHNAQPEVKQRCNQRQRERREIMSPEEKAKHKQRYTKYNQTHKQEQSESHKRLYLAKKND